MIDIIGRKFLCNGQWLTVVSMVAAGKHIKFMLSDGSERLDLHKADIEWAAESSFTPKKKVVTTQPLRIDSKSNISEGTIDDLRDTLDNGEDLLD